MSRIALVYPYFRTRTPTELLFAPLGVACLAGQLHRLGMEARVFDCTFSTFEKTRESLLAYRPDVVGVYCMVTLSRNTFRLAESLRADLPGALLVAGGPLPTLYPSHFTAHFDAVLRGEADQSFPHFCRDFFALQGSNHSRLQQLPLDRYPGLTIHREDLEVANPPVHHSESDINSFPLPWRRDFDHAAYQQEGLRKDGLKTTSLITTYGCPFSCDFCSRPIFGSRFRRRSLDLVIEEIGQVRQLGYDCLWIADDNFTLDLVYLQDFCHRMLGSGLQWSCLSRVTGLDLEVTRLMKAAGCRRVYLGLETGSQETLELMNKKATLLEGIQAVHSFHAAGIQVAAFFIVGYPGETVASIEETFRLALSLPLDEISFNVPFPLPGSPLFERVSGLDMDKDWDKENEVTFVYNSGFDETWLRGRIEATMAAFAQKK